MIPAWLHSARVILACPDELTIWYWRGLSCWFALLTQKQIRRGTMGLVIFVGSARY